jgi:hypothetical protein
MINAEKYRDEILAVTNKHEYFALKADNPTVITRCNDVEQCRGCLFDNGTCSSEKMKWLLSEYKEPVELTKLEYNILTYILKNTECRYITRNKSRSLCVHSYKPVKDTKYGHWTAVCDKVKSCEVFNNLFPFIKWEDSEPTLIQGVLNNCEVVESDL